MRIVYWVVVGLGAVVLTLFAVSNRGAVVLGVWPLPFVLDLPLYLVILVPLLLGFAAGRLAGWFAARPRRQELRRRRRRIEALERELAATQALLENPAPSARLPAASG